MAGHRMGHTASVLEPLQQVQVVTIRVLETDHAGAPGLVLRRTVEPHASRPQPRIQHINICHRQADMIDARWIAEQAQLPLHRPWIILLRREYEQVYGAGCHHHAAVVSVRFGKTQFLIERDQLFDVGRAHAYVVDALYHCRLSRSKGYFQIIAKENISVGARRSSAMGHKQTFALHQIMSALPPKADIERCSLNVRWGPTADIIALKVVANTKRSKLAPSRLGHTLPTMRQAIPIAHPGPATAEAPLVPLHG